MLHENSVHRIPATQEASFLKCAIPLTGTRSHPLILAFYLFAANGDPIPSSLRLFIDQMKARLRTDDSDKSLEELVESLGRCGRYIVRSRLGAIELDQLESGRQLLDQLSSWLKLYEDEDLVVLSCLSFSLLMLLNIESTTPLALCLPESLSALDPPAFRALMLYSCLDRLEGYRFGDSESRGRVAMSGVSVASALLSSTQSSLIENLLCEEEAAKIVGNKALLRFGSLWWGRNEAGEYTAGEYDVLSSLNSLRVSMWLVDLRVLLPLIEKKALSQFRENRDSMKVTAENL